MKKFAKGGVTNAQRKSVGRNLAKRDNQRSGQGKPTMKFAGGGMITIRGTGAATKGLKSRGLISGEGRSAGAGITTPDKD